MKYSYSWLKNLSGTNKSPEKLAELLTMRAFELEGMKKEGKETQLEFSILPNRAHDALSHVGMAREICAVEGRKMKSSRIPALKVTKNSDFRIDIRDKSRCPRYAGSLIENVKISASPKWMQEKLLVSGIKPINNIVDITNYVMLETGQPLHAFDAEKTTGNIIVRRAAKGENIKLLDEKIYELDDSDLVIADSKKVLALAGVMGGFESSVTEKTASVIFESANFNSTSIRKTRTRLNIMTESSYRFEREIDPNLAGIAMVRALELMKEISGKKTIIAAITDVYPKKVEPWQVKLDTQYVSSLLGEDIPVSRMKKILENLGMKVEDGKKSLLIGIPTVRIDLKSQEDLVEEIGRIYGYENIKDQAPLVEVKTPQRNKKRDFEKTLRDILAALGFSEVMNYSFYSADDIKKYRLSVDDHIEVVNPLSLDQQYLRSSLVPNILKSVKLNLKNFSRINIFEIGNEFYYNQNDPKETTALVGAMTSESADANLFFELKGKLEAIFQKIDHGNISYREINEEYAFWHQSRTAEISLEKSEIGRIGEISPIVLQDFGIKGRVAVFGIRISNLFEIGSPGEKEYGQIGKFPSVERDISMFVGKKTKYSDIVANIEKNGGKLVKKIGLLDVFEKEGEKSLALRIEIGSKEKTLTAEEIDVIMQKIATGLEKSLKVKVRK